MSSELVMMVIVITAALLFDFFNGFHDAANAIATIVITKALTPAQAVLMAGAANFIGYFFFGVAVAKTVGSGMILVSAITLPVLIAALAGAILWNIITWLLGLPTSSSHALIGGLVGAAIAAAGFGVVVVNSILTVIAFIVIAPLLGYIGAVIVTLGIMRLFQSLKVTPATATAIFKPLQLVSAAVYAVAHGTNDAQKSMGIIALALVAGGVNTDFKLDGWVVLACYSAIGLGTMFGGWKIVKTMGTRITKIRSMEGFCAETASSTVMLATAHFGIPVSTTHVIAGSIMGVGTVEHAATVRWVTARKIMWAWILTIPLTGTCAAAIYWLLKLVGI